MRGPGQVLGSFFVAGAGFPTDVRRFGHLRQNPVSRALL